MQTTTDGSNKIYRIVLADDHRIVRHAIRTILESSKEYTVVAEGQTADETITAAETNKPDFLILDIGLPGKSGIEVIYELKERGFTGKIAILTMYEDEARVLQAMYAGADAYLLKTFAPSDFLAALKQAREGQLYVPPQFSHLLEEIKANRGAGSVGEAMEQGDPLSKLSKREREIFYMLAAGVPNRHIAKKLFISARTVETHRARVIKKLGFNSTADLIRYAIRYNLITL